MKKFSAILLSALIILSLAACTLRSEENTQTNETTSLAPLPDNVIRIGVFEPQTGADSVGGKTEILGIQYANKISPTVDIGGKTYEIELIYANNESSAEKAVSAAETLVSAGVSLVLGSYDSTASIEAAKVFEEAKIPVIGISCTNPMITQNNPRHFRIGFIDPQQGAALADFAYSGLGAKKAYVLSQLGSDDSEGLAYYFKQAFERLGGETVSGAFLKNETDFTEFINYAKNSGVQLVFAPVSPSYAYRIIEQSYAQNLSAEILAGNTWDSSVVLSAAKDTNLRIYTSSFYRLDEASEFYLNLKKWLDSDSAAASLNNNSNVISSVTAMGFDAYFTAVEAMKKAESASPEAVFKALGSVKYEGVTGMIEFNETGDAKRKGLVIKTANTVAGKWNFFKEQSF